MPAKPALLKENIEKEYVSITEYTNWKINYTDVC